MKPKSLLQTLALLVTALILAAAPATRAADDKNSPTPPANLTPPPAIDATTGLPVVQPPPWKDPNWKESGKSIDLIHYDGLGLPEIAQDLRARFKDEFDIIIPNNSDAFPNGLPNISLQLKNVTASEIFNAMNLSFDTENVPLRWSLVMNGKRPTAVLHTTSSGYVQAPAQPQRAVIFVGEILGDEKSGRMPIEQLVKTLSDIYQMAYNQPQTFIQFHKDAEVLVVTGTVDQINFVRQTLVEVSKKTSLDRLHNAQKKADETRGKGL